MAPALREHQVGHRAELLVGDERAGAFAACELDALRRQSVRVADHRVHGLGAAVVKLNLPVDHFFRRAVADRDHSRLLLELLDQLRVDAALAELHEVLLAFEQFGKVGQVARLQRPQHPLRCRRCDQGSRLSRATRRNSSSVTSCSQRMLM